MEAFDKLVGALARLPGVGRRSAERMATKLVRDPGGILANLAASLDQARNELCCCSKCGSITTVDEQPCRLCTSPRRDTHVVCVVEDPNDIVLIERSGGFRGRYHALMGKLSPIKGEGARNLRLSALLQRIDSEGFTEVILATSTDVEGDATANLVADLLKNKNVRLSRLAFGLPASSGISYSDPVTLQRAINGRQTF